MGQCCDKQKIHVVNSIDDIPLNTTAAAARYHVMISYALSDKSICRRLAHYLSKDNFRIWFHPDPIENEFKKAMTTIIDNSDCIVLCVSDTYSQTYRCQKEARYASDMQKRIIMVKVAPDYKLNGWLSFIKPGKIQFELSDNKENFEITYRTIMEELRRITKLDSFISHRSWEIPMSSNIESSSTKGEKHRLDQSDVWFRKRIKRPWCFDTSMAEGGYVWETIDGFIGSTVRTDEEMNRRYQLDSDLSLMTTRRQQLSSYFNADSQDRFCIFAERMRQNMIDWQKFCEK